MSPFPALPQSIPPTNPPCRTPVKQMIFVRSKLRHRRKKVIFRQHCHINICNYWLNWQFVNSTNITANIERAVLSCVFFVLLSLDDVGLLHRFPRFWNILKVLEYFEGFEIFWMFWNILKAFEYFEGARVLLRLNCRAISSRGISCSKSIVDFQAKMPEKWAARGCQKMSRLLLPTCSPPHLKIFCRSSTGFRVAAYIRRI